MHQITTEELAILDKKVKAGNASNEETIQYLDIVNGLLSEFIEGLRSMPTEKELQAVG